MYDPGDLGDGAELCIAAGRDPNEVVATFTLTDYAAVLIGTGRDRTEIIDLVRAVSTPRLADSLLAASHWDEIFEAYADWDADHRR